MTETRTTCTKCRTRYEDKVPVGVALCSLHGAAERMLEALEVLLGAADDVFPPQAYKAERKQARAAIKEARA